MWTQKGFLVCASARFVIQIPTSHSYSQRASTIFFSLLSLYPRSKSKRQKTLDSINHSDVLFLILS